MKAVIQRVKKAKVTSEGKLLGKIGPGLVVLLGICKGDDKKAAEKLAGKILKLRIFPSQSKNIDRSVCDTGGDILVVSQFTLCADCSKGRRPSFVKAAPPEQAEKLYDYFIDSLKDNSKLKIESGQFGAMMEVELTNSGPVTIVLG